MRLISVVRCLLLLALTSVSPISSFADSIVQVQVGWMFQDRGGLCLTNRPGLNENCILSTSIWNITGFPDLGDAFDFAESATPVTFQDSMLSVTDAQAVVYGTVLGDIGPTANCCTASFDVNSVNGFDEFGNFTSFTAVLSKTQFPLTDGRYFFSDSPFVFRGTSDVFGSPIVISVEYLNPPALIC